MPRTVAATVAVLVLAGAGVRSARDAQPTKTPSPIFVFHQPFWINLHHVLYVLGRVEAKMPDIKRRAVAGAPADQEAGLAALTDDERGVWRDSVGAYAKGLSRQDAVFDDELVRITGLLVRAGSAPSLAGAGIDAAVADILSRAAPVYRKAWWPRHDAANRKRVAELEELVARHGSAMLAYITRAYQEPWPADGFPIQIAAFSNWAGAYSTRGDVLIMSSLDDGLDGAFGLETAFHEAMHQWDNQVYARLRRAADRQGLKVPGDLSHAMIFYTAGEAARSVVPGHATYAERAGMWKQGGFARFRAALDEAWKPHLEGRTSLDAALDALIKASPQ
jgi:hypothetical protein